MHITKIGAWQGAAAVFLRALCKKTAAEGGDFFCALCKKNTTRSPCHAAKA